MTNGVFNNIQPQAMYTAPPVANANNKTETTVANAIAAAQTPVA